MGTSRRLHPLTILKELGTLAWAIAAALVVDFDLPTVPGNIVDPDSLIAVALFGYAVARYLFTSYELNERTLVLRRGVFVKRIQTMPRDRIQAVGVNTGFVGRFVGVSSVEVSAADTEQVNLSYVSHDDALELRRLLDPGGPDFQADAYEAVPEGTEVATLSKLDAGSLALYAVTESALLGAGVVLMVAVTITVFVDIPFVPLAVLPMAGWPVLRAVNLVGFHSWIDDDRLKIVRGLLSRRETDAPVERIQAISVGRPLIRRLAGHETVTMATGDITVSGDDPFTVGIVAPLVEIGGWRPIAEQLVGRVELGETDLLRSSPFTVRRTVVRGSVLSVAVATLAAVPIVVLGGSWWAPLTMAVSGMGLSVVYARRRYRILGWVADDDHLLVRRGVVSRDLSVVPVRKVQDVSIRSTFFQRRLGIASVVVDTAGVALAGLVKAVDLDEADARSLAEHLAARAARIALRDGV